MFRRIGVALAVLFAIEYCFAGVRVQQDIMQDPTTGPAAGRRRGAPLPLGTPPAHPTPPAPPDESWRTLAWRVFNKINDNRLLAEAASVTYFSLLAVFPALAALVSIYGLIADPATVSKSLTAIEGIVPWGGMQLISDEITALTSTPNQALGFGAIIGLLTSLWSANAGVKSLFDALNVVYGVRETRGFLHRTWLSFAFTLGALAFVIIAMSAVVVVPTVLNFVGAANDGKIILSLGRWPILLSAILLFLALTYRFGPDRHHARWRWISPGSAMAGIVWIAASAGFSWYVANFGSYNKTYGSLGAAVGFMTWIWISTIIVLTGAQLDVEREGQGEPVGGGA